MEQYKEQVRAAATNADRFSPLESTLVIVLLRNVYDWTEAMRRLPYHSPSHVNLTLDELLQARSIVESEQRTSRPQSLVHTRRLSPCLLSAVSPRAIPLSDAPPLTSSPLGSRRGPSAAATPKTRSH